MKSVSVDCIIYMKYKFYIKTHFIKTILYIKLVINIVMYKVNKYIKLKDVF